MQENNLIYVAGEQFDRALETESMPGWRAAAACPFCSNGRCRMRGEYVEKEAPARSGTLKKKLLVWTQIICPACGADGPIAKRDIPTSAQVTCSAETLDKLSRGNRVLMGNAAALWNRRYS